MIEIKIIAALLHDVSNAHGLVFNTRSRRLTLNKISKRLHAEGIGFLTKTLPRLGKAFDKALAGDTPLTATEHGFEPMRSSELPKLFGEFFSRVLQHDGNLLPSPCSTSVRVLRQLLFAFYKYELPYTSEQEQQVIQKFEKTEDDLSTLNPGFHTLEASVKSYHNDLRNGINTTTQTIVTRRARSLLTRLFRNFDPTDIRPRHGPGAVATRQRLWDKYLWTNVSAKITEKYPFDAYFCASLGHVCDSYQSFSKIGTEDLPARVILVPKDSRGPRLISCEPVDYQWVQQGLGRAVVELVESHWLTKHNVHFTDQSPNRIGAIYGSENGRYSTLDLKEASDRVSVDLVRLLFPEDVYTYLMACRSSSTELPDGRILNLRKFAPMGSCLCFPIMALTIWAILTAAAPDADTRERILVYGDDVIVPTAYAGNAIEQLESFGLKINRDKSCTRGLFRESCGMDAFQGVEVTPVRLRTVWSSKPSPEVYSSWISYANSFYDKQYFLTYDAIVSELSALFGPIPGKELNISAPSLREVPERQKRMKRRWNKNLQKFEYYVRDIKSPSINKEIDGWSMLLRYFAEVGPGLERDQDDMSHSMRSSDGNQALRSIETVPAFSVSQYTSRKTSMLVWRWR